MSSESNKLYRKTPKGVLTNLYHKMKERRDVDFSLDYFHTAFLNDSKYLRLHDEWARSGFIKEKKPSIDRISNKKGYTKENIQMMTWAENRYKQTMERRNRAGAVLQIKDGVVVNKFRSQREAVIKTGVSQGNMSECLNGKRPHCKGFVFIYEHPNLLDKDA